MATARYHSTCRLNPELSVRGHFDESLKPVDTIPQFDLSTNDIPECPQQQGSLSESLTVAVNTDFHGLSPSCSVLVCTAVLTGIGLSGKRIFTANPIHLLTVTINHWVAPEVFQK
jgi:hypothetical protein